MYCKCIYHTRIMDIMWFINEREKCYPHQARKAYLGSAMRDRYTPTHVQTSLQISAVFMNHASRESDTDEA